VPPSSRLVSAALILVVLALAAGLAVLRLVDSNALRAVAETRLSALLGQRVTIGAVGFSFLPSLTVTGRDVAIGATAETVPSLHLSRILIVPQVRSLFSGPIAIDQVTLDGLEIRILRDATGHWRMPPVVPTAGGDAQAGLSVRRLLLRDARVRLFHASPADGARETSSISSIDGEIAVDAEGLRATAMTGRVGGALIVGDALMGPHTARLSFRADRIDDVDLPALLGLMGADRPKVLHLDKPASASVAIEIDRQRSQLSGRGSIRAPGVALDPLRLHALETPFTTDGVRLVFEPSVFELYRGRHTGKFVVDLSSSPAQWVLTNRISDIAIGELLAALSGRDQRIDGTASMAGAVRGRIGDPLDRVEGNTRVTVLNGVIRDFPLLAALNRALRLAEGSSRDTRFDSLTATFALGGRQAATRDLVLVAREARVEAAGRIGFDRSLDLAGRAALSPERTESAIRSVRELTALRNARGELEIPLTISGTADNPSIAIDLQSAIARALKEEIRRRLLGIIKR
jgi:uncharacterized protein involved in outer membrane biogenesis